MEWIAPLIQLTIALSIYNVWLLRYNKPTDWRGGTAKNMKQEFEVYGFPFWFMILVGALKIILATLLIAGIWLPVLAKPAALGLAFLMVGAVLMHFRVRDAPLKALPASVILVLSLFLVLY